MTTRTFSVADLDRTLQDHGLLVEVIRSLADRLRARHDHVWLWAFLSPDGLDAGDEAAMLETLKAALEPLNQSGRMPQWDVAAAAAGQWLKRMIRSRSDQWGRLVEATDKAATSVSVRLGPAASSELFLGQEHRPAVVYDLTRALPSLLGVERMVASSDDVLALAEGLVKENLGAGALEEFIQDDSLSEIMVGAGGHIWVERKGQILDTGRTIPDKRALWFGQRLAAIVGSRVDASEPSMDGFLPDGSRVHVLLPPVALDGVSITIRRHIRRPTLEQLLAWNAISPEAADFLHAVVSGRANTLISGGTSSGKTTLLNVVAGFISATERVVTMEDSPELQVPLPHVIRLRTRRKSIEGQGEFTMRHLVRESLRMRPDRIVVGEVRGAEALDMIEALNTGHDGGLSTAHANGAMDMLKRLGQMAKRGDPTLTDSGAYELIASALHLVVHAERRQVGDRVTRGVEEIVEVLGYSPDRPGTLGFGINPLFRRGARGQLEQVGTLSDRLARHLSLNGTDVTRWR